METQNSGVCDPRPVIEQIRKLSRYITVHWRSLQIPAALKERFSREWKLLYPGRACVYKDNVFRLGTSTEKADDLSDANVLRCIITYPLYRILEDCKKVLDRVRHNTDVEEWPAELRKKLDGEQVPRWWPAWQTELDTLPGITDDQRRLVRNFVLHPGEFADHKGISRSDFTVPALAKAVGLRVDHYGIILDIVRVVDRRRETYDEAAGLLEDLDAGADDDVAGDDNREQGRKIRIRISKTGYG